MPTLHQWDYLFAFGVIFAALDAFNIGANDVANSFATSVSSRSLTLRQACIAAALCEFLGAVLVGAKVAGTIKNGIISLSIFSGNAGVQLLAFTVALTVSASWLMICTRYSMPVSTTYSIVSALAGVGVATGGTKAVQWGWNGGRGLGTIFAGFVIAPSIAAVFASVLYLITKYAVLKRENTIKWGLIAAPFYFFTITAVLTMSIVYKGSPNLKLDKLPEATIAMAIVFTALVVTILSILFWLPYVHAKVVKKDYTIKWYHFFYGPLLWKRPAPSENPDNVAFVPDYRIVREDGSVRRANDDTSVKSTLAGAEASRTSSGGETKEGRDLEASGPEPLSQNPNAPADAAEPVDKNQIQGLWWEPKNYPLYGRKFIKIFTHGSAVDIHAMQAGTGKEAERQQRMWERSHQYDNETEHLYSFLQVMTACTNSFAHGANDVSNAIGPFAAIYYVWKNGAVTPANTDTETWMLAFGGAMIVIGLATYGYNIMAVLGNKLTLMSPSRGMCMEAGAAITVLLASQYGIPVSTTMCIVGATTGVGVISGGVKNVNWRGFLWIFFSWVVTVPVVGTLAGCMMGIILNAPKW